MSGTKRKNFTGNLKAKAVLEAIRGIKTVNGSVINALEAHSPDKFPDHGIDSFKRSSATLLRRLSPATSTVSAIFCGSRMWNVNEKPTHATFKVPTDGLKDHSILDENLGFRTNSAWCQTKNLFL